MAADLTTYDKILKEDYAPSIEKQFNSRTVLLNTVKRDSTTIEGRQFVVPTQGRLTEGVGSRSSTSASLPTAGDVGYDNAIYTPKYHWGKIQVSQVIIEHTKRDSGAFTKAVTSETKGLAETMSLDLNRQVWNDGTGRISDCGVTAASLTVVLGTLTLGVTPQKYRALGNGRLRVGMYIDILVHSTGAVLATNRKITAISKANNTITIDGAVVTTDTTHGIYRAGNKALTVNYEVTGLRNLISATGAIGALDPATAGQEYWASAILDGDTPGTNQTISEVRMLKVVDLAEEGSTGKIKMVLGSTPVRRAYFNLLVGLKRTVNSMTYEGGWKGLDFNGMAFLTDLDATPNQIQFLDNDHLKWYELARPQWMDADGSILKWDQGTGYVATYYWFANFGTDARNTQGVLKDITES